MLMEKMPPVMDEIISKIFAHNLHVLSHCLSTLPFDGVRNIFAVSFSTMVFTVMQPELVGCCNYPMFFGLHLDVIVTS